MNKKTILVMIFLLAAGLAAADTVVVSQADNSALLTTQKVRVYVSPTNDGGATIPGLQAKDFTVWEAPEGGGPKAKKEIVDFVAGANANEGVNIVFLIDNSGSMYDDVNGRPTKSIPARRMTYAKKAIEDLLPKIKNPADRLGLIAFNVKTSNDIPLTDNRTEILQALSQIEEPERKEERYTELYESLHFAVGRMGDVRGRKVIILLSDGENVSYTPPQGQEHPQFTARRGLAGAIEAAQREGISVFTIGIGSGSFQNTLKKISQETGGVSYQTGNLNELADLYSAIQERVLSEYLMTYYAGMEPADRKTVTVELKRGGAAVAGHRSYYSATLFGKPQVPLAPWIFAFILLALLFLFLLWKLKPQNRKAAASLEVLSVEGRKSRIQPVTIMESQHELTISGDADADLTLSGDAKLANSEIKLFREGNDYTLMSAQGAIKVNNQPVKAKKLRSGDLITMGNTTIVFDGGALKRDPTQLMEKTKTSRLRSDTEMKRHPPKKPRA